MAYEIFLVISCQIMFLHTFYGILTLVDYLIPNHV